MSGWIKLHRCLMEKAIFQNEKLLKVFIWCLLKASHSEHEQLIGRQKVTLQPGQFPTGRHKAAVELNMSPSTAWSYLKLLEANNTIDIKSNNKFSVVTVVNWGLYQTEDNKPDSKYDNIYDNKKTTNRQQIDTNKNDKNDKNDKYSRQVYDLLNYWNEQNIVVHQETDNTLRQIEKGLKNFSFDEIKTAIDRYVTVYRDSNYYYKHKWTLPKFLTQRNGIPDFLDEGIRWVNYQDQAPQQETSRSKPLEFY